MSLKSLLITIFFAVCIDRSFEYPDVIQCGSAKECVEIVKNNFTQGPLPILVTKNEKKEVDDAIVQFFEDKPEISTILKVNVNRGVMCGMVRYLHRNLKNKKLSYPFVTALHNNMVICHLSHGCDYEALNKILTAAISPTNKEFIRSYSFFTNDMTHKINSKIEFYKGKNLGQTSNTSESQELEEVGMTHNLDSAEATNLISSPYDQSNLPKAIIAQETSKRQLSTSPPLPPKKRSQYRTFQTP